MTGCFFYGRTRLLAAQVASPTPPPPADAMPPEEPMPRVSAAAQSPTLTRTPEAGVGLITVTATNGPRAGEKAMADGGSAPGPRKLTVPELAVWLAHAGLGAALPSELHGQFYVIKDQGDSPSITRIAARTLHLTPGTMLRFARPPDTLSSSAHLRDGAPTDEVVATWLLDSDVMDGRRLLRVTGRLEPVGERDEHLSLESPSLAKDTRALRALANAEGAQPEIGLILSRSPRSEAPLQGMGSIDAPIMALLDAWWGIS